jgi:hypothetical protein
MLGLVLILTGLSPDLAAQEQGVCVASPAEIDALRMRLDIYARAVARSTDYWRKHGGLLRQCRREVRTLQAQLAECHDALEACIDPCAAAPCANYQECRIYEPTGEAFCADTCDGFPCREGERCELIEVPCPGPPCPPIALCVPDSICDLPPETGECAAALLRWYHDARSGRCERFVWGGCGGNANNFESLADCEATCPPTDPCLLRPDPGPCDAAIARWYFDSGTGRCQMFIYGGCEGNANNFATRHECEGVCPPVNICELPADTGPCEALIPRWHFDPAAGECRRFIWGGCGGNANNFANGGVPSDRPALLSPSGAWDRPVRRFAPRAAGPVQTPATPRPARAQDRG